MKKAVVKLEKAYFELLKEYPYDKIPVSILIGKAGVSRTTFYRNYEDIIDMYHKTCRRLIDGVLKELVESFIKNFPNGSEKAFCEFCVKLNTQKPYIFLLCSEHGSRYFLEEGMRMVYKCAKKFSPFISEEEIYALRIVALSGIALYIRGLLNLEEAFPAEFLKVATDILKSAKKVKI